MESLARWVASQYGSNWSSTLRARGTVTTSTSTSSTSSRVPYGDLLQLPGYREQVSIGSRTYTIFNVHADGNCLFHSLAAVFRPVMIQRGKTPPTHVEVRQAVMQYYRTMPASLKEYLESNWPQDESIDERLATLESNPTEWGNQQDVFAAANFYRIHVTMVSTPSESRKRFIEEVKARRANGQINSNATAAERIICLRHFPLQGWPPDLTYHYYYVIYFIID